MRTLNLLELEEKINSYTSDINYADRSYIQEKVSQFFAFLHDQSISKRILERINEDFSSIKSNLPLPKFNIQNSLILEVKGKIKTREDQGAFGYFIIQELYEIEKKYENHYLNVGSIWYRECNGDYDQRTDCFKEKFFKPFSELLEWYIYESVTKVEDDYYSKNEITNIIAKLDDILKKQEFGNEIIFNEVDELKELILFLNKKNWGEIVKGKIGDLVTGSVLNIENAKSLFNNIVENGNVLIK